MNWYTRAADAVRRWTRSITTGLASLRSPPARPGATGARVSQPQAEQDLHALATAPAVFAGMTYLALSFMVHPIRVYRGNGGQGGVPLDPESVPWVGSLLRLLQSPDPYSAEDLAPEPGELLLAQIVADLRMTGNFYVAPTLTPDGDVIGLARLHPRCCSIERRPGGAEEIVYRNLGETRHYPRRSVFHGRLLSWQSDGRGEIGLGAGTPLKPLVEAEATALQQTADIVRQGGADLRVVHTTQAGAAYMANEENRKKVVKQVTESLAGEGGRRVFAMGGDVKIEDAGFKPSDLRAPETLAAARANELVAIGVVPAAVGMDAGTYASAVTQLEMQALHDEGIAAVLEVCLFRPLAQRFARRAGGRASQRPDLYTARLDLSQHPGYGFLRSEVIKRMQGLRALGYATDTAAQIEGQDFPRCENLAPTGAGLVDATPGPEVGSHLEGPRRPVGQADGDKADVTAPGREVTLRDLFGRNVEEIAAK